MKVSSRFCLNSTAAHAWTIRFASGSPDRDHWSETGRDSWRRSADDMIESVCIQLWNEEDEEKERRGNKEIKAAKGARERNGNRSNKEEERN